ncbi:MAG TPA: hypothetical protein VFE20_03120 [Thermoleophilia bacterium]|nr:hypothetical protein [Thermoleophilia bacterium]
MGLKDMITNATDTVAKEAEKAIGQGRHKVEEFQFERQMDTAAKKLGYLEFESQRSGSTPDAVKRQELIAEMTRLEGEMAQARKDVELRKAELEDSKAEDSTEAVTGLDETGIGPEEVTGVNLPEDAERRLES